MRNWKFNDKEWGVKHSDCLQYRRDLLFYAPQHNKYENAVNSIEQDKVNNGSQALNEPNQDLMVYYQNALEDGIFQ